jgi:hypothetical protein
MPPSEAKQIIAFKNIHTLTPMAQVEEVERLATKEPSRLNFALNIYLAQLYKFTFDRIYCKDEKNAMGSITAALALQLNGNDNLKAELDTFSLNAAKKTAAAAVIDGTLTVSNQCGSYAMR